MRHAWPWGLGKNANPQPYKSQQHRPSGGRTGPPKAPTLSRRPVHGERMSNCLGLGMRALLAQGGMHGCYRSKGHQQTPTRRSNLISGSDCTYTHVFRSGLSARWATRPRPAAKDERGRWILKSRQPPLSFVPPHVSIHHRSQSCIPSVSPGMRYYTER